MTHTPVCSEAAGRTGRHGAVLTFAVNNCRSDALAAPPDTLLAQPDLSERPSHAGRRCDLEGPLVTPDSSSACEAAGSEGRLDRRTRNGLRLPRGGVDFGTAVPGQEAAAAFDGRNEFGSTDGLTVHGVVSWAAARTFLGLGGTGSRSQATSNACAESFDPPAGFREVARVRTGTTACIISGIT
ncbi:MAG: hypothetical protein EXQ71_00895 [Acidimicrobiia bacterium]|nr:hypothetical protein [Acidimicrobiia bacterium]